MEDMSRSGMHRDSVTEDVSETPSDKNEKVELKDLVSSPDDVRFAPETAAVEDIEVQKPLLGGESNGSNNER